MTPLGARRVVLVRPGWGASVGRWENTYNRTWPPLSCLYVITALRERGVDAALVDLQATLQSPARALAHLGPDDCVIVYTADVDRWQCPNLEMAPIDGVSRELRARGIPFLLAGPHGAAAPEWLLARTGADGVLTGEPEEAALALGLGSPPQSVPGLVLREGDGFRRTALAQPVDMARLSLPDYGLIDLDRYRYELLGERFALFEGSRGCPFPCAFCSRLLQGRTMRRKDPQRLIAEVERAVRRDRVRSAYLIDLEFHLGGATSLGFCEFMARERLPLRWCCQLRPAEVTDSFLDALAAAGCRLVHCGVETGSPERASAIRKGGKVDEMLAGVERILDRGMEALCFFILGFPGESRAEMEHTIRAAVELNPTYASFHLFTPYPGTSFAVAPGGDGPFYIPPTHPDALDPTLLASLRRAAYLRFYLRPGYVLSRVGRGEWRSLLRQAQLFVRQVLA
jgi:anaerobic magnesium-protoporphyrin IX monomethyl ester cyclase